MDQTSAMTQLALHTPTVAGRVKTLLEAHGVAVSLADVTVPGLSAMSLSVQENDVEKALKIIESGSVMAAISEEIKLAGMSAEVLIPVDFSELSLTAVAVGFDMARRLGLKAVVLHAYPEPLLPTTPTSNPFAGDFGLTPDYSGQLQLEKDYESDAQVLAYQFEQRLRTLVKEGKLSDVPFTMVTRPGVPEEVIRAYTIQNPPVLVVMATRGRTKREQDLVGSVTAEVLDTCRVPVFTVPDDYTMEKVEGIRRLAFFCNLDRQDVMSVDFLMRMFDFPDVEVALVPVSAKEESRDGVRLESFRDYLAQNYPEAEFTLFRASGKDFKTSISNFLHDADMQLLIVPNKKKNIFLRLFDPGIPHRVLYERDIPMLALPV